MANLSNINNILRISSSGVGLNKDNTGPSELDIESAGADMIDMTRTGLKTYRFAISGSSDFSIFDVAANADRLTIDSAGNVGIGGSPNDALEVAGNSAATHRIRINNANASGSETLAFVQGTTFKSWIEYNNSNGNFDIWQYTNNDLRFGTNNTERLVINSSGNATFAGDITLDDGTGASPSLIFTNSSDETWKIFNGSQGVLNFTEGTNDRFQLLQGGDVVISESLRVGGNVNNANTFTYTLQTRGLLVAGNSGTSQSNLYLHRDDATITNDNVIGNLHFSGQDGASNIGAQIQVKAVGSWNPTSAGSNMIFSTCNSGTNTLSERMRITSGGQVNMTKGSSGTVLYLDSVNAYDAETGIQLSAGRAKISGFLNTTGGTPGSSLRFYTMPDGGSVTERLRIDSNGFVTIKNTPNTTAASLTLQNQGDVDINETIGYLNFSSTDASTSSSGGVGGIGVYAEEAFNTSFTPTYMSFYTHERTNNDGSVLGNVTERMRIADTLITFPTVTELRGDIGSNKFAIGNMGDASSQMMISSRGFLTFNVSNTGSAKDATERMRITSAGNSFFNYSNGAIETYGSGAYGGKVVIKASGAEGLSLLNNSIGGSSQVAFNFTNEFVANQYNFLARIIAEPEQNWTSDVATRDAKLSFFTSNNGSAGERMTIGSTGRITMQGLDGKTQTGSDVRFNTSSKELYYNTSSKRYKTNIVNLESSLDKINELRPVRFKDIKTGDDTCGLIAEETFEIIPDVVFTKEIEGFDEPQIEGINYSDIVPFLIKSIQELKAEVDLLKKECKCKN